MKKNINYGRQFSRRAFLGALGASAVAAGFRFPANAAEEKKLNFFNWDTYIGETTLDDFKRATGIEVQLDLFADNSELFAKMREGNSGYDVVLPSDTYIERLRKAKLIQPLDHSKIPNLKKNVGKAFQDSTFDPGRQFSVPYMWGTMGIGYRKSKVAAPTSWGVIWGEESNQHAGRIGWMNESEAMMGMALRYLGYSYNETDAGRIKQAADQLIKYKKNAKGIFDDNGQDLLASGEVDMVVEWNGDIAQLITEDPDIGYVIPPDGGFAWEDGLCIPTGAPHPENAHAFLNFLLEAEVGRDLAEYIQYATTNTAARALMDDAYNNNPAIFPPDEVSAKLETALYLGEARSEIIDKEWTRVLSS
ncbi:MAG: ABC transporter substrate-binding protein [Gammaproteobacteria bacterium WSBS_2016_MAG_OTU1]